MEFDTAIRPNGKNSRGEVDMVRMLVSRDEELKAYAHVNDNQLIIDMGKQDTESKAPQQTAAALGELVKGYGLAGEVSGDGINHGNSVVIEADTPEALKNGLDALEKKD